MPTADADSNPTPSPAVPEKAPAPEKAPPIVTIDVAPTTPALTAPAAAPEVVLQERPPEPARAESVGTGDGKRAPAEAAGKEAAAEPARKVAPASILAVDIGGTKVKILATGQTEPRKAPSGKGFTPAKLVETVRALAQGCDYEVISIGYPGMVGAHGPRSEPGNLGPGWVGFDFAAAFGKPVKMVNDAAMQALGSYEGGRMLFLGLGTGLGSALIAGHVVIPMELGRLPAEDGKTLGELLGRRGLDRVGKGEWRKAVNKTVTALMSAFVADYVVVGGGNAKYVKDLPPGTRLGHNLTAFRGGFRVWSVEDVWVLAASGGESDHPTAQEALRML
jgi:polyphosphate glucokinase